MNTREFTLGRDPTNVKNVGRLSMGTLASFSISESTQGRSPISVMSVGRPSFRGQVSFDIRESTVEKNLNPQEFRETLES